jgi:hypothetical protein
MEIEEEDFTLEEEPPEEPEEEEEKDFIEDYTKFILRYIDTNPDWAEASAIQVLNAVVSDRIFCHTKIGKLNTNLFYLAIGPSGLAMKSASLKYFVFPILTSEKMTHRILPNRFSVEGFISYLKDHPCGLIIRDEFSSMFKDTSKSYLGDVLEFLSELYDGTIQKRATKKGGIEDNVNVNVSLIGATTPYLFQIMEISFFVQGTGNRILYFWNDPVPQNDKNFTLPDSSIIEREQDMQEFQERLERIDMILGSNHWIGLFTEASEKKIIDFRNEMREISLKALNDRRDIDQLYYIRLAEMMIKLATIKAFSSRESIIQKMADDENIKRKFFPVAEKDVDWAISRIRKHIEYFKRINEEWRLTPRKKPLMSDEEQLNFCLKKLEIAGEKGLTTTEWYKSTGWLWDTFKSTMQSLLTRGDVEVTKVGLKNIFKIAKKKEESKSS